MIAFKNYEKCLFHIQIFVFPRSHFFLLSVIAQEVDQILKDYDDIN